MFGKLRRQWHDLATAKPGRRFQNRYYGRKRRRDNPALKVCYIVLGALIVVAGIALLPAPGPGALVLIIGAAMLAEESLWVARACDAIELKVRAWIQSVRRAWKRA